MWCDAIIQLMMKDTSKVDEPLTVAVDGRAEAHTATATKDNILMTPSTNTWPCFISFFKNLFPWITNPDWDSALCAAIVVCISWHVWVQAFGHKPVAYDVADQGEVVHSVALKGCTQSNESRPQEVEWDVGQRWWHLFWKSGITCK